MQTWTLVFCAALVFGATAGCSEADDDSSRVVIADAGTHDADTHDAGTRDAGTHDAGTPDAGTRDAGDNDRRVLVGAVDGSDIALGAVLVGGRARMFFCGGARSYATATHWLQLELDADGGFEQAASDGFAVQGSVHGASLQGTLMRPGEPSVSFSAELVRDETLAGLYEGSDDCGRVGLIVTQPAAIVPPSGQGACVGAGHVPQQVNPILPLARLDDGSIRVELVGSGTTKEARVHAAAGPSAP